MARKKLTCKFYIGDKPIEQYTDAELQAWQTRMSERLSSVMSDYYTQHPEEFEQLLTEK